MPNHNQDGIPSEKLNHHGREVYARASTLRLGELEAGFPVTYILSAYYPDAHEAQPAAVTQTQEPAQAYPQQPQARTEQQAPVASDAYIQPSVSPSAEVVRNIAGISMEDAAEIERREVAAAGDVVDPQHLVYGQTLEQIQANVSQLADTTGEA